MNNEVIKIIKVIIRTVAKGIKPVDTIKHPPLRNRKDGER